MKIILSFIVTFACMGWAVSCSSRKVNVQIQSQAEINELRGDSFTVVYCKPVNGYKVRAVVKPGNHSFLSADITFEKDRDSFTLHSLSFGDTIFNKGWWGELGDNDSILQKYRNKTVRADYHENNAGGETMAVWCPFFFRDLDFDDVEELVIVHYTCAVRYHNGYDVYRIVEGKSFLIDEPPYNNEVYDDFGMTDYPEFNFNDKTISCPYPEGELKQTGRIVYGISREHKDTVVVNGRNHFFNHLEPIKDETFW